MSYKVAVASDDNKHVNVHFGSADEFYIYEVDDDVWHFVEKRSAGLDKIHFDTLQDNLGCLSEVKCTEKTSCRSGGCGNNPYIAAKIDSIADCRCVLAQKIGFQIQKQLERKCLSFFDVDCSVDEALQRIVPYFHRLDNHLSLRGFVRKVD